MKDAHEMKDLAPRDVVTRAILAELEKSGEENVYLDASKMTHEFFEKRFPTIFAKCAEYGIDPARDGIPVRPGQHYLMGGIETDLDGCTSIRGLYACGETAHTGIHGANRLASNSMLECLVFGRRCARYINGNLQGLSEASLEPKDFGEQKEKLSHEHAAVLRSRIREKMTKYAGPVRTREGLLKLERSLSAIARELEEYEIEDGYETELYNMCQVARLVVRGAINRKESIGAHYILNESLCAK
jgi:L-aspartate oxidase